MDDLYAPADTPDRLTPTAFTIGTIAIVVGAASIACAGFAVVLFGLPAHLPITLHPTDQRFLEIFTALAAHHAISLYLWLVAMVAGLTIAIAGLLDHRPELQTIGVALVATAGSLFWFGVMNPALAERETLRGFAQAVSGARTARDRGGSYRSRRLRSGFLFAAAVAEDLSLPLRRRRPAAALYRAARRDLCGNDTGPARLPETDPHFGIGG